MALFGNHKIFALSYFRDITNEKLLLISFQFLFTSMFDLDIDSCIGHLKSDLMIDNRAIITKVIRFDETQSEEFCEEFDFENLSEKLT